MIIIAIGNKLPEWTQTGIDDYQKRFISFSDYHLEIKQISTKRYSKKSNIKAIAEHESQSLIDAVPKGYYPIALDVTGEAISSEKLATQLQNFHDCGENIAILIGGPDGFNDQVRQFVQKRWSLSNLTMPHHLARLLLVETLYRSIAITKNHPYHRKGEIN